MTTQKIQYKKGSPRPAQIGLKMIVNCLLTRTDIHITKYVVVKMASSLSTIYGHFRARSLLPTLSTLSCPQLRSSWFSTKSKRHWEVPNFEDIPELVEREKELSALGSNYPKREPLVFPTKNGRCTVTPIEVRLVIFRLYTVTLWI